MNCPICGKHATLENNLKGVTIAAGIGAGGYMAANSGAAGAVIGSMILPDWERLRVDFSVFWRELQLAELPGMSSEKWSMRISSGITAAILAVILGGLIDEMPKLRFG